MQTAEDKQRQWIRFYERAQALLKRRRSPVRGLTGAQLSSLIDDYQALLADLARARSLGAPTSTIDELNRIAVAGHNLLYGHMRERRSVSIGQWYGAFARVIRRRAWAVALSAVVFFGPAVGSYFAVQVEPALGYDLVGEEFLDFDPANEENLHSIPSLARPIISSVIIANNLQVTLLAFGFGLTAGIGTTLLLVLNGIHLGSVAGWMTLQGSERALWGWIMPHGATELLAICFAGAAGYLLAGALVAPGQIRRSTALKRVGGDALTIEFGCMAMLVIAGLIEGFISPSGIDYRARVVILIGSLCAWTAYFVAAGQRARKSTQPTQKP